MIKLELSRIDKLKLFGQCVRAITGIVGGSLVLVEGHPYIAIAILATGATANEIIAFIKDKENIIELKHQNKRQ